MTGKDPVGDLLAGVGRGISAACKKAGRGLHRLKGPAALSGLAISAAICLAAALFRDRLISIEAVAGQSVPVPIRYLFYWLLLLAPFFFLMALGSLQSKEADEYEKVFQEIGFIGKDKRYPYLVDRQEEGRKTILTFRSNIPLSRWEKTKDQLETGFDYSIRQIREGGNKKTVRLITVSSDYKIPDMVSWNDAYMSEKDGEVVIGESDLEPVRFNLNRVPHVLAAGETGSGKSVILRLVLWQLVNQGCCAYMIDFKGGVEFGKAYEQFGEVITERERARVVLEELVKENDARLKLFRELEVKNLWEYNQKTGSNLCRVAVVIDEIAEMLDKTGTSKNDMDIYNQLEGLLSTLARLSRATGINLLLGVQRPDAKVLPGQIKNNIPVRISGRFTDKSASGIVLGTSEATQLSETKGRFLYKVGNKSIEFQAYYFDDGRDLHEVEVETGDMLTRGSTRRTVAPVSVPEHRQPKEPPPPWEEEHTEEEEPWEEDTPGLDFDFNYDE